MVDYHLRGLNLRLEELEDHSERNLKTLEVAWMELDHAENRYRRAKKVIEKMKLNRDDLRFFSKFFNFEQKDRVEGQLRGGGDSRLPTEPGNGDASFQDYQNRAKKAKKSRRQNFGRKREKVDFFDNLVLTKSKRRTLRQQRHSQERKAPEIRKSVTPKKTSRLLEIQKIKAREMRAVTKPDTSTTPKSQNRMRGFKQREKRPKNSKSQNKQKNRKGDFSMFDFINKNIESEQRDQERRKRWENELDRLSPDRKIKKSKNDLSGENRQNQPRSRPGRGRLDEELQRRRVIDFFDTRGMIQELMNKEEGKGGRSPVKTAKKGGKRAVRREGRDSGFDARNLHRNHNYYLSLVKSQFLNFLQF